MHYALMLVGTKYARYYVYASLLVVQMECQNDSSLCLRDLATATRNCQHYDFTQVITALHANLYHILNLEHTFNGCHI